ncbi:hypothetical protein [Endozoicomonas montiporae]|uniref:Uncharacterized protein n=1 Tax=Endozoicomonas montiporae CL-33 TaxID=570277 RepID=A0A142BA93_9GAMM|nr:hypothetical protein [Endozoicomonas montiporae]AMO55669.1 hypothetical protein EZMO1_1501 [Endozoicomonas montiporae CL-33]
MEQRIVCAAVEIDGFIVTGYRHYDQIMNAVIDKVFTEKQFNQLMRDDLIRDGFIDNRGAFLDRKAAWEIALKNKQIIRDLPSAGALFSENLY